MAIAFLGLGSSLGDKQNTLEQAIEDLKKYGEVVKTSPLLVTEPEGGIAQNQFVNAVIKFETNLSPQKLLEACQAIENQHGRTRTIKWEDRTLDIDILTYDNQIIDELHLKIPHPLAHTRDFILKPLGTITEFEIESGKLFIKN